MASDIVSGPRSGLRSQVTSYVVGTYVIWSERVLLMFHDSLGRWVPPGGRIDLARGELPHETALRKSAEETGIDVDIIAPGLSVSIDDGIASPIPQPMLIQKIEVGDETYLDFVYVATAVDCKVTINYEEARGYHWFTLDDLARFPLAPHVRANASRALETARGAT